MIGDEFAPEEPEIWSEDSLSSTAFIDRAAGKELLLSSKWRIGILQWIELVSSRPFLTKSYS